MEHEDEPNLEECKQAIAKCIHPGTSIEECKVYEDIYGVDVAKAFKKVCESSLGISGLRLDLFLENN